MAFKITLGLCDILCGTHFYISTVYASSKEVRVVFERRPEENYLTITDIILFENADSNICISSVALDIPLISTRTSRIEHELYSVIEKVTYIVYLSIDILILTYKCSGTITNILRQILSENISKPTTILIRELTRVI
jgi:hypothetical protein